MSITLALIYNVFPRLFSALNYPFFSTSMSSVAFRNGADKNGSNSDAIPRPSFRPSFHVREKDKEFLPIATENTATYHHAVTVFFYPGPAMIYKQSLHALPVNNETKNIEIDCANRSRKIGSTNAGADGLCVVFAQLRCASDPVGSS